MLGAIVGDVVGSVYEFNNIKQVDFPLFSSSSTFTDDTLMTLAVAKWLTTDGAHTPSGLVKIMQEIGHQYPHPMGGYGGHFSDWLQTAKPSPYNSWGNGSAMRVSPVAHYASSFEELLQLAQISAAVTHNHPEGIKGAQAIASATFMARKGASKVQIKTFITQYFGYDLTPTLQEIRPHYSFDVSCQGSVPEALIAFLEGESFEEVIRLAISIGGDSDTIAAMSGAVAGTFYGIPTEIAEACYRQLTPDLRAILDEFEAGINTNSSGTASPNRESTI